MTARSNLQFETDAAERVFITMPGLRNGRYLTLQERYAEWRATPDGQLVYDTVRDAAFRLRARGFTRYGVAAIFEAGRYSYAVRVGPDAEGFKLNNNWRSRLARELMDAEPELDGFFDVRELKA